MGLDFNKLIQILSEHDVSLREKLIRDYPYFFVRSQDQVAHYSPEATGRVLSAWQVYSTYGLKVFDEILEFGSAVLPRKYSEPANTLKNRRESLGLTIEDISKHLGCDKRLIEKTEDENSANDIHLLTDISVALGIDDLSISFTENAHADNALAGRLKSTADSARITKSDLWKLSEAAWIAAIQAKLISWLEIEPQIDLSCFEPDDFYGNESSPAWRRGYFLAEETRKILGLDSCQPIESLRSLCEEVLAIPLIQTDLSSSIAGATISNGDVRAIVVNTSGGNRNELLRRVTLAHELGHFLWDPDGRLQKLSVDLYDEISLNYKTHRDYVEQRANAFAVDLLCPGNCLKSYIPNRNENTVLRNIMDDFGVSLTSAKHHLQNRTHWQYSDEEGYVKSNPDDRWKAAESDKLYFFPMPSIPDSRRGLFAYCVSKAYIKKFISLETASLYLDCSKDELCTKVDEIASLYVL